MLPAQDPPPATLTVLYCPVDRSKQGLGKGCQCCAVQIEHTEDRIAQTERTSCCSSYTARVLLFSTFQYSSQGKLLTNTQSIFLSLRVLCSACVFECRRNNSVESDQESTVFQSMIRNDFPSIYLCHCFCSSF